MNLMYFEEVAYDELKKNIAKNAEFYISGEDWLDDYFNNSENYYRKSGVIVNSPDLMFSPMDDLCNTRILHNAFKNLTPLQATNKYMWTYLSHVTFKDYILSRWMQNPRGNTILTRFFVTGDVSLLNDNAISRLWWYGYLTHDDNNQNPYHLTEILLKYQQICTDIMDTPFSKNKNVIKGILLGIKDFVNNPESKNLTETVRSCMKYLRRYSAVTIIDALDEKEIENLVNEYMKQNINIASKTASV